MQATHTLNIGLHTSDRMCEAMGICKPTSRTRYAGPLDALCVLRELGVAIYSYAVQQSDSEPTLVVRTDRLLTPEKVNTLCFLLRQEAMAQYSHIAKAGWVEGPMSENWGPFNPEYFVLIDGRRLSATEEA